MRTNLLFSFTASEIAGLIRILMTERLLTTDSTVLFSSAVGRLKLRHRENSEQHSSDGRDLCR